MKKKIGILIAGVAGLGGLAAFFMKGNTVSDLPKVEAVISVPSEVTLEQPKVESEQIAKVVEKLAEKPAELVEKSRPNCKVVKYRQATSSIESSEHQLKLENLDVGQGFCLKQGKKVLNLASKGWVVGRIDDHKDLSLSFCKRGEDCHLPCQSKWVEKKLKQQSEESVGDLDVEDPKMAKEMRRLAALLEEDKLERLDAQANQWHVLGEVVSCDER